MFGIRERENSATKDADDLEEENSEDPLSKFVPLSRFWIEVFLDGMRIFLQFLPNSRIHDSKPR